MGSEDREEAGTRRRAVGNVHRAYVDALCTASGVERSGFLAALRSRCPYLDEMCVDGEFDSSVVPDAYWIDDAARIVLAFEVEVSNPLSTYKLDVLSELFWILDEDHYLLHLVTIDRYGTGTLVHPYWFASEFPSHQLEFSAFRLGGFAEWLGDIYSKPGVIFSDFYVPDPSAAGGHGPVEGRPLSAGRGLEHTNVLEESHG